MLEAGESVAQSRLHTGFLVSAARCPDRVALSIGHSGLDHVIVDDELRLVSPGDVGELCVAGSQTFPGYWRDPARTCARSFNHTDRTREGRA